MTQVLSSSTLVLVAVEATPPRCDRIECGQSGIAGPGWFDSSWELRSGLQVDEGLPSDLGVCAWIETWLQVAAAGASPSLSAT